MREKISKIWQKYLVIILWNYSNSFCQLLEVASYGTSEDLS